MANNPFDGSLDASSAQIGNVKLIGAGGVAVDFPLSAFGDLRTVHLSPLLQLTFEYTVGNTALVTNTVTNGGTVTQGAAMAVVGTSATTGSTAMLQSKQHAKYRAGLGGLQRFTMLYTNPVANTVQYFGIMDERSSSASFKNGYAFGYNGTTFTVARWANDVLVESVALANWSHAPTWTLDPTKLNVAAINFQYLGAGKIDFYLENPTTGFFELVHRMQYANAYTVPSTYNPNFHFTIFVDNKSTTSNLVVKCASAGFFVEGSTEFQELHQPQFSSGTVTKAAIMAERALFTVQNKATYASATNFIDTVLALLSVSIEASAANNQGTVRLVRNATLGGVPSYTDISTTNSVTSIDTAGTTVTGGQELFSLQLANKNDRLFQDITTLKNVLNPGDFVTVAVSSVNSATFKGSLLWKELF